MKTEQLWGIVERGGPAGTVGSGSADYSHLVIFDGVCNLCESSVNFIIDHDSSRTFRFVPSQSELGEALQQQYHINTENLDTVVLIHDGGVYAESDAAMAIAREFDGIWQLIGLGRIVPRPIRDAVYRWIARNRYAWFGRKDVCMMTTPEIRDRFLESVEALTG